MLSKKDTFHIKRKMLAHLFVSMAILSKTKFYFLGDKKEPFKKKCSSF